MIWPDAVNAIFEGAGIFFVSFSIIKLSKDKAVKGVSILTIGFFTAWGYWNLFYYPFLDQWLSAGCAAGLALMNTAYLIQILYYGRFHHAKN